MRPSPLPLFRTLSLCALALFVAAGAQSAERKVLLIAGPPSHGPRAHEHNAGVLLLQKCLGSVRDLKVDVSLGGWPADAGKFTGVDAVIIYADGGLRHIALTGDHLAQLGSALKRGANLGLLHYAVEPTKEKGQSEFTQWVGGAFEIDWSVNPHWDANFKTLPTHPVTRGVRPFTIRDEWYFNLRFTDGMKGVTPILFAIPDASTVSRPDGHHSGNAAVRAAVARGDMQTVAWAFDRPDGGRGFGFTGAHFHDNWANDDFRRVVLNAIVWLAKLEVPAGGVQSRVTAHDLSLNLDPKPVKNAKAPKKKAAKQ